MAFNALTDAQLEALDCLQEEAGELIQAVAKIKRHGLHNFHPETKVTNYEQLQKEMTDLLALWEIICYEDIGQSISSHAIEVTRRQKQKYFHHILSVFIS